ncbi:MAG TPA: diacylglycerol kinase family protein [Thermoanaerobaculia bacterium]|nr:diacylglycerol kinase family protein [Thermoanaerobaculia bacterium]
MRATGGILFLNPRAGSFAGTDEDEFRRRAAELDLRIVALEPGVDAASVVRDGLQAGVKKFVVAGGDGSIHTVAQGLVGTDGVLGIVPIGTVNHMARDLQIPGEWQPALELAVSGEVRQIDTGRINGIHFLNSVMVGIYPTITNYREKFRSTHSKWRAYLRAVRLAMRQFRHVTLVLELPDRVETLRTQLFVVSINSYDLTHAGLVALKTALDDGRLTIYSLDFMNRAQFVQAAAKFFRGKLEQVDGFRRIRTEKLRIDAAQPKIRVSIDGEVRDLAPPLQIAAVPASLLVRTPAS